MKSFRLLIQVDIKSIHENRMSRLHKGYDELFPQIQANMYFNIYKGFYLTIDISPRISTKLIFNGSCVSSIYADTNVT